MIIIRALLFKYFRHYFAYCLAILTLWFVQSASTPLFKPAISEHFWTKYAPMMILGSLSMVIFAAWGLFISFIVHEAPLSGTTEFWMTRPISRRQLFISKFIIIALFFALIPSLSLVACRAFGLLPPHIASLATFTTFPSIFSRFLCISLCLMLLASLTRNTAQFVFCMLGITICFYMALTLSLKPIMTPETIIQNHELFGWVMKAVTIVGLFAIIYNQYIRRKPLVTISATALLALLLMGIWQLWPTIPKP